MKELAGTINLKPTPTGYATALINIIINSNNQEDIKWAKQEIIKLIKAAANLNPEAWGKESN